MKLIEQSWMWIQKPVLPLNIIELAGRTCYKSEDNITNNSSQKFVEMILKSGHESVIEHVSASVKFITNRGVTHELVRHRLCAYSQESTRYVNYGGSDIEFIKPVWSNLKCSYYYDDPDADPHYPTIADVDFISACCYCEDSYNDLLAQGWTPQQAREVLPNALKTEIVMTANLREWRHVFNLRTSKKAHPQIRKLMIDCLRGFKKEIPVLFDNIGD